MSDKKPAHGDDNDNLNVYDAEGRPAVLRYKPNERSNHWLVAITFVLLALSGLALFHPSMFWLTGMFGGGPWTRILHPFVGVVMFLGFVGLVVRFWHHNLMTRDDVRWLLRVKDVIANKEEGLPEAGRYNGGQKMLFYGLLVCMIGLMLTGIVIWRSLFSHLFPIGVIRVATLLHALFGFGIIVAIVVHIYAAIWVKGTMGAMIRGTVSYGWVKRNHPAWYREIVASEEQAARQAAAKPPAAPTAGSSTAPVRPATSKPGEPLLPRRQ